MNWDPPTEEELRQAREDVREEQENWDPLDLPPGQEELAKNLHAAGAPDELISRVGAGVYDDYVSPHPMPKHKLVADCEAHDLHEVAQKAKQGHYDRGGSQ